MKKIILFLLLVPVLGFAQSQLARKNDVRDTLNNRLGANWVTPQMYGGTDATAIQAAINALKGSVSIMNDGLTNTSFVYFPEGTYTVDSNITTYSGIGLVGVGQGSIIKEDASFKGDALISLGGIGIDNQYWKGKIEGLTFVSYDTASTIKAVKQNSSVEVVNSVFKNLHISCQYGLFLNQYTQSSLIENITHYSSNLNTILHLVGNHNIIRRIDKENSTGWSATPYIVIGDSSGVLYTERNTLEHILIEGVGTSYKTGIYFVNADYNSIDDIWLETIPALSYAMKFDTCEGINYIGKNRIVPSAPVTDGQWKFDFKNTGLVVMEEYQLTNNIFEPLRVFTLDTLSELNIKSLYATNLTNFRPIVSNIKIDKVYQRGTYNAQSSTLFSNRRWITDYSGNSAANLLGNPSFEAGMFKWGEVTSGNGDKDSSFPASTISTGKMLKIDFASYTGDSYYIFNYVPVKSGITYQVSAKVKMEGDSAKATMWLNGAGLGMPYMPGDAEIESVGLVEVTGTQTWKDIVYSITPTSDDSIEVGMYFYGSPSLGDVNLVVYLDDFTVTVGGNTASNNNINFQSLNLTNKNLLYLDNYPTTGTWNKGDIVFDSTLADNRMGWVCTVAGTPGTWESFGFLGESLYLTGNNVYNYLTTSSTTNDTNGVIFRAEDLSERISITASLDATTSNDSLRIGTTTAPNAFVMTGNGNITLAGDLVVSGTFDPGTLGTFESTTGRIGTPNHPNRSLDSTYTRFDKLDKTLFAFGISNVTGTDYSTAVFNDSALTISKIYAVLRTDGGGNDTADVNIYWASDISGSTSTALTSDTSITNVSTGTTITSFGDATIPAGVWVWAQCNREVGTVNQINITVRGKLD